MNNIDFNVAEEEIVIHLRDLVKKIIVTATDEEKDFSEVAQEQYDAFIESLPKETYPPSIRISVIARGKDLVLLSKDAETQSHMWSSLDRIMNQYATKDTMLVM